MSILERISMGLRTRPIPARSASEGILQGNPRSRFLVLRALWKIISRAWDEHAFSLGEKVAEGRMRGGATRHGEEERRRIAAFIPPHPPLRGTFSLKGEGMLVLRPFPMSSTKPVAGE